MLVLNHFLKVTRMKRWPGQIHPWQQPDEGSRTVCTKTSAPHTECTRLFRPMYHGLSAPKYVPSAPYLEAPRPIAPRLECIKDRCGPISFSGPRDHTFLRAWGHKSGPHL